jgi:hypothetical protein
LEEDTVELINYLRVIWKRKILIIAGTLVCMVAVWVVNISTKTEPVPIPPQVYRAETIIRIGKKLSTPPPFFSITSIGNSLAYLVISIPAEYSQSEYPFKVEAVGNFCIKLTMEGVDREKIEGSIKRLTNKIMDDHIKEAEDSLKHHVRFISEVKLEIERRKSGINPVAVELDGLMVEGDDLDVFFRLTNAKHDVGMLKADIYTLEAEASNGQKAIEWIEEHKTKMIGVVKTEKLSVVVAAKKVKKSSVIIMGGIVGFVLSLLLAFFMEYLDDARKKEKGDKNDRG